MDGKIPVIYTSDKYYNVAKKWKSQMNILAGIPSYGGVITDAGGATINISAGQGFIRALSNDTSTLFTFDWSARSGVAIPNNTIR